VGFAQSALLARAGGLWRAQLAQAIELVLAADAFTVERSDLVVEPVKLFGSSNEDFSDCVIAATARAANELPLATFGAAASRLPDAIRLGRKRKR
jgi:predicted nucleic-acid-binding protein